MSTAASAAADLPLASSPAGCSPSSHRGAGAFLSMFRLPSSQRLPLAVSWSQKRLPATVEGTTFPVRSPQRSESYVLCTGLRKPAPMAGAQAQPSVSLRFRDCCSQVFYLSNGEAVSPSCHSGSSPNEIGAARSLRPPAHWCRTLRGLPVSDLLPAGRIDSRLQPASTGFAFLPFSLGVVIGAALASFLLPRLAPRLVMAGGFVMASGGMIWFTQLSSHAGYWPHIFPAKWL